tara:strand:- start:48 stop:557 length:510 start_codon:yes stop_codon:yes gene_type:complete
MTVQLSVEVDGLAATLKALKDTDPELRKQVVKQMKTAAKPAQSNVRALLPGAAPLSNWGSWPRGKGYDPAAARKGVKIKHKAGARQTAKTFQLVTLQTTEAAAMIFDIAGRRSAGRTAQGQAFIRNLKRKYGAASRTLYPGTEAAMPEIERGLDKAVDMAGRAVTRKIR